MDENPYQAPREQGGGRPPPKRHGVLWQFGDLALLFVVGIVVAVPVTLAIIFVLSEIEMGQRFGQP